MNQPFSFKEIDKDGQSTLEAISAAPRFNRWMYETTSQRLTGNILEIGSGIGNISEQYLNAGRKITLSDIRENYCEHLQHRYASLPNCSGVLQLDLVDADFEDKYAKYLNTFDGVFALNVIEHIENDQLAITNCRKLLKTGGRLVILVPAYQWLYNSFDRALEHYRRYTKKSLAKLFAHEQFDITNQRYFNAAAMAGWWFSGNLLKKEVIPTGQMKIYNALVPAFRVLDYCLLNRVGISVVIEGIKTS